MAKARHRLSELELAYWERPYRRIATKIGEAVKEHYEVPQELPEQLVRLIEAWELKHGTRTDAAS